jgi:Ca2+/Na+ antiporter
MSDFMAKSFCIICSRERQGIEVEDDFVLGAVRWFKRNVTHNEKNNRLVVCKEDYEKYKKSRSTFEFRQKLYLGFGVVFMILMLLLGRSASAFFSGILLLLLFYAFSFLSYTPKLKIKGSAPA